MKLPSSLKSVLDEDLAAMASHKRRLAQSDEFLQSISGCLKLIQERVAGGGTVFVTGDRPSFEKAAHLYEELIARFRAVRPAIRSLLLNGVETLERRVENFVESQDVLVVFFAEDSPSLQDVVEAAKHRSCPVITIGHTRTENSAISISSGCGVTYLDQSLQSLILHLICEQFEPEALEHLSQSFLAEIIIEASSIDERSRLDRQIVGPLQILGSRLAQCVSERRTVYLAGNGGSACDAIELAKQLQKSPINSKAVALLDPTYLTCVCNDWSWDNAFSRALETAREGEVLLAYSTSGNSANVLAAVREAKSRGVFTFAMSGKGGGKLVSEADATLVVPSDNTARIQEVHDLVGRALVSYLATVGN